jgi:hypothetical protein
VALTQEQRSRLYETQRRWRKRHPGRAAGYVQRYRDRHPEVLKKTNKRWRMGHPECDAAVRHRRRARKLGNGGSYTTAEWLTLKTKYDSRCLCCGKTERQLKRLGRKLVPDHVLPLAKKGRNDISNLQPLCHGLGGCNNRKHTKHIDYRPF